MTAAVKLLNKAVAELLVNKRLFYGMVLIALVVSTEAGLRWSDWLGQQQTTLTQLQTELTTLKSRARDEATMRFALAQAQQMAQSMDARLWTVSSEAVGQARLKDWLTDIVKRSIANQYVVTLGASRELGKPSQDPTDATPAIREFRATVSFQLTPQALEGVLLDIEGGEPFAAIETLVVKKLERRVELTVRVLMRVKAGARV